MSDKIKRFDHIDSLRGVAILMVMLVHTAQSVNTLSTPLNEVAKYGQMGVQLFFVLSAITLCHSMSSSSSGNSSVMNFYFKRFFRIAPLYYTGIFLYFSLMLITSWYNGINVKPTISYSILANLSFIHGFVPFANNTVVPGGWSIGTEMAFYLIFPLLFKFTKNRTLIFYLLLILITLAICFLMVISVADIFDFKTENHSFLYYNLVNMLPVFILGMGYYFISANSTAKIKNLVTGMRVLFLLVAALILALVSYYSYFHIMLTPFLSAVSFVLMVEIFKRFPFLNAAWLKRIGQLSYSIYIFHFLFSWYLSAFVCEYFDKFVSGDLLLVICYFLSLAGSLVIAILSERWIEKPGIRLGSKLATRMLKNQT